MYGGNCCVRDFQELYYSFWIGFDSHINHEDQYTFFIMSRSILLKMRNLADKSCR